MKILVIFINLFINYYYIGQVFAKGSHELYVGGIAINRMKYQPRVNSEDIIDCNDYLDSTNTTATLGDIIKYIKIDDSNLTTKDFDNINIINNTSSNNNLIPVTFHDWILNKNIGKNLSNKSI